MLLRDHLGRGKACSEPPRRKPQSGLPGLSRHSHATAEPPGRVEESTAYRVAILGYALWAIEVIVLQIIIRAWAHTIDVGIQVRHVRSFPNINKIIID